MKPGTASVKARRKFFSAWDEMDYLYHKVLHWSYGPSTDRAKAKRFALRLEQVLSKTSGVRGAIKGQEYWSLVYEVKGDLPNAIKHRRNEIRLWKRFLALPEYPALDPSIVGDHSDLADRLICLGFLYKEAGEPKHAIASIDEARAIAASHGFCFEEIEP